MSGLSIPLIPPKKPPEHFQISSRLPRFLVSTAYTIPFDDARIAKMLLLAFPLP